MKPNYLRLLCLMLLLMTRVSGLHAAVDYLCFTAEETASLTLSVTGTITADIQTSRDGVSWTEYTFNTNIDLATGEKVYFRGNYQGAGPDDYASFFMFGKMSASGNIMTLTDGDNPSLSLAGKDYCFYSLFSGCLNLTSAPALPATTLANYCYSGMFVICSDLTEAPELPATTLATNCYETMFSGCTKLTAAPALPATTLANSCYLFMFFGCTGLTEAPELPATTLAEGCYMGMFHDCTGLTEAPELPATTLAEGCYIGMFSGCEKLNYLKVNFTSWANADSATFVWMEGVSNSGTFVCPASLDTSTRDASHIPAGWIVDIDSVISVDYLCFTAEEAGFVRFSVPKSVTANVWTSRDGKTWTEYTHGTDIVLAEIGDKVYFKGDYRGTGPRPNHYASFVMSGKISASGNVMTLTDGDNPTLSLEGKEYCFYKLFFYCNSLTKAPALPATTLSDYCYCHMFSDCTGLTEVPELPAVVLSDYCYESMFIRCSALTEPPALPATDLAERCYSRMFYECTELTAVPELPATTLSKCCYYHMFYGCTKLTAAPELRATTLTDSCYYHMFSNCTDLTEAPELPATTLAVRCYEGMFFACTGLTEAPELPATTLAAHCYSYMFSGCTKLNYLKVNFTSWTNATLNWVNNVSPDGTFVCPEELDVSIRDGSHVPAGWTVVDTGISPVMNSSPATNGATYNIFGQRVNEQSKGIVIQNGKKYLNR